MRNIGVQYWGSILPRLPLSITKEMNESHLKTFEVIYDCARRHGAERESGAVYTTVSQMYVAKVTGLVRETVSRAVGDLQDWGLLHRTRRRQVGGRWQTNLYRLGRVVLLALGWLTNWIISKLSHVTNRLHIGTTIRKQTPQKKVKGTFNNKDPNQSIKDCLERIKDKAIKAGRWGVPTT